MGSNLSFRGNEAYVDNDTMMHHIGQTSGMMQYLMPSPQSSPASFPVSGTIASPQPMLSSTPYVDDSSYMNHMTTFPAVPNVNKKYTRFPFQNGSTYLSFKRQWKQFRSRINKPATNMTKDPSGYTFVGYYHRPVNYPIMPSVGLQKNTAITRSMYPSINYPSLAPQLTHAKRNNRSLTTIFSVTTTTTYSSSGDSCEPSRSLDISNSYTENMDPAVYYEMNYSKVTEQWATSNTAGSSRDDMESTSTTATNNLKRLRSRL